MSLHKLTAGDGYTYLTRQVAAQDATSRGYATLGDYYSQKGESPGVWMGRGLAGLASPEFAVLLGSDVPVVGAGRPVSEAQMRALFGHGRHPDAELIERIALAAGHGEPAARAAARLGSPFRVFEGGNEFRSRTAAGYREWNAAAGLPRDWPVPAAQRARIRTAVARTMFAEAYDRPPADARELSGFLARVSRQATTAVAGYDLTFSPPKSVSALWALAPPETARTIERAHQQAVADTVSWLEQHAVYTRTGHRSVRQVDTRGLIAAAFTHRDSRAGDPDLHTHVAVSNKVQATDGRWLALDGRPIHKMTVAASERYNTRVQALLADWLGLAYVERAGAAGGKRPVFEVAGVDERLLAGWSRRGQAIVTRSGELAHAFQDEHGRPPTTVEALHLAQQANLETRQRKHEPRSLAEQRAAWRADAAEMVGGRDRVATMLQHALHPDRPGAVRHRGASHQRRQLCAARVLARVQAERATWQECHVRAEVERAARADGVPLAELDRVVDVMVREALGPAHSVALGVADPVIEPLALRRRDGTSVYTTAGSELFTSAAVLAAERRLLATAGRRDGRRMDPMTVEMALLESTANEVTLNPGQAQLVRDMACSGARLQLALAPAGTGKTTAMRVLARAWAEQHGRTSVLGLAPSAAAAAVLRAAINPIGGKRGAHADTLAKLLDSLDFHAKTGWLPDWVRAINDRTLVVIDEAGMAATTDLDAAVGFLTHRGASVRLIGDDQQLASVGAGGVLRDIARTAGAAHLSQVVRFTDPASGRAEAAASLALRDGDPAALAFYADHGRIHVGEQQTVTEHAYQAWAADRAAGRDAVLLAPTHEIVLALNLRARADRLAASHPSSESSRSGREAGLADGSHASAGDVILACRNARRLRISRTEWVKNGDRFTIDAVRRDGRLRVRHVGTGRHLTLPARYVATQVRLGYAATVHTAQGITADTCHLVATGAETRQLLYVGLSRGQLANHVWLATVGDGDPHSLITRDALLPPTGLDLLARVLARDGAPQSATSASRQAADPGTRLAHTAARYHDALLTAATTHLGPKRVAALDTAAEAALPGLTEQAAYPTLRADLALLTLYGRDPAAELRTVIAQRELGSARDIAAVLHWRLDTTTAPRTSAAHTADTGTRVRADAADNARPQEPAGPLPWLPAIPQQLAADPTWSDYLPALANQVATLARQTRAQAQTWTATTVPRWAAGLLALDTPHSRSVLADLAVWRAATGTELDDPEPAGPPQQLAAEARHQRRLRARVEAVLGDPSAATARWRSLLDRIEPRVPADPYWPRLAQRLTLAAHAGIDIAALTRTVAATRPLPDEAPAAALWWRISQHLQPGVLPAESTTLALRPAWTPVLAALVGADTAEHIIADSTWPALVAAVTDAAALGWQPAALLPATQPVRQPAATAPADSDSDAHGDAVRPQDLATAWTWRIRLLTDPPPPDPAPEDPRDRPPEEDVAPTATELQRMATTVTPGEHENIDEDWIASLQPPDDAGGTSNPVGRRPGPGFVDKLDAVLAFDRYAPRTDPDDACFAALDEQYWWDTAAVPRARLVELNTLAADYYAARYRHSWAPGYLTERLGTDLTGDLRFTAGYAPPGWNHLVDHLRHHGASDEELLAAGLAARSERTGRVYDRFRDRLVLPLRGDDGEIIAFIARRNPAHDAVPDTAHTAGPKYLNTPTTDLYTKGRHLYGITEASDLLAAGATPVLVEGPFDAIAVTSAGEGSYVGIAAVGTALTDAHIAQLRPYLGPHTPGIIVATDADTGGRQAATRDYWLLTAHGDNPRRAILPDGLDPAELRQTSGDTALRAVLDRPASLAATLIADRLERWHDRLDTAEGRAHAARAIVPIIAALPPDQWLDHLDDAAHRLGSPVGRLHLDLVDAAYDWIHDPSAAARHQLAARLDVSNGHPDARSRSTHACEASLPRDTGSRTPIGFTAGTSAAPRDNRRSLHHAAAPRPAAKPSAPLSARGPRR